MKPRKHRPLPFRVEKRLAAVVGEDWCPNIAGSQVLAFVVELRDGKHRVAVWGGDDTGLERDCATKEEAIAIYEQMPDPIAQQWCLQRGFVRG